MDRLTFKDDHASPEGVLDPALLARVLDVSDEIVAPDDLQGHVALQRVGAEDTESVHSSDGERQPARTEVESVSQLN